MKICILTHHPTTTINLPKCDVALLPFTAIGDVDYQSELSGKTDKFEDIATLSARHNCAVLCGCVTDSLGLVRKSVAVCGEGKLLGISDMQAVFEGENLKPGIGLGVYRIGGYKIGVLVENDLYFPENIKSLVSCGCNLICVHFQAITGQMPPVLIRSYAYLYGVPIALCAQNCAYLADITGSLAHSSKPVTVFSCNLQRRYRLVTSRVSGVVETPPDY